MYFVSFIVLADWIIKTIITTTRNEVNMTQQLDEMIYVFLMELLLPNIQHQMQNKLGLKMHNERRIKQMVVRSSSMKSNLQGMSHRHI